MKKLNIHLFIHPVSVRRPRLPSSRVIPAISAFFSEGENTPNKDLMVEIPQNEEVVRQGDACFDHSATKLTVRQALEP